MKKTKTTKKLTVRESIVKFLTRNASKSFTAKGIAKAAKLNYNTVRKELGILTRTITDVMYSPDLSKNKYTQYRARAIF